MALSLKMEILTQKVLESKVSFGEGPYFSLFNLILLVYFRCT